MCSRVVLAVTAVCYLYFHLFQMLAAMPLPSDFGVYYAAGRAIWAHRSPFHDARYLYSPLFAFLVAPIGPLTYLNARYLWLALSHAFLLGSAWALWLGAGRKLHTLCCIAIVWTFGGAAAENLALGQIGPLLLVLLVLTLSRRPEIRGLSAGIGTALKYMPGLLAAVFILGRDWRALGRFFIAVTISLAAPWLLLTIAFPGPYAPANGGFWMGTPAILSWSIPSGLLRLVDRPVHGPPAGWLYGNDLANFHLPANEAILSLCASVSVIVIGLGILVFACRGKLEAPQMKWAVAGAASLAVVAAPISWTHYQILNYPGIALLLSRSIECRSWKLLSGSLLCFVLTYQAPVLALRQYYAAYGGWPMVPPAVVYLWTSISPIAGLALFALLMVMIRRESRAPKTETGALAASAS